ncbi:single-stranded DNA-binding protein [Helicobacter sp. MIT 05-5293]|uniref:Single-stranded DNA-binding protein n=1 Tax=uncultured Helicobacter sp. TaxID=175537 RepID=A0A650EMM4_9HELI|nr:single-stranded DNA-binding protein [Helicobacter sp. MIT 05-5293]QGT50124.1 hypothetical protein Helico4rc_2440 [uncultured Helicobacter sp.]TLD81680.1 single-stranded DNA-binding protein [Helicobacter sp. MIT 05-5293]
MYNKVIIMGNLTRDVELRYLPSGSALATIGLASNRRYKKQDGSLGEEVCFVDVKLFGRSAEVANQYLRKGSRILIEGRLTLESWTDQSGAKRSKHTITAESMQMLDSKSASDNAQNTNYTNAYSAPSANVGNVDNTNYPQNIPEINIDDEDIPF